MTRITDGTDSTIAKMVRALVLLYLWSLALIVCGTCALVLLLLISNGMTHFLH